MDLLQSIIDSVDITKAVGIGIGSAIAALCLWYKKKLVQWWKDRKQIRESLLSLKDTEESLRKIQTELEGINYYVSPNGGGSLMDAVSRTEATLTALEDKVSMLSLTVEAHNDTRDDVGMFFCDVSGGNTYVNLTYARWLRVGKRELYGWDFMNIIHPEDAEQVLKLWEHCRGEKRQYRNYHRMVTSEGETIYVYVVATPIPEGEPPRRWIGAVRKYEKAEWERLKTVNA